MASAGTWRGTSVAEAAVVPGASGSGSAPPVTDAASAPRPPAKQERRSRGQQPRRVDGRPRRRAAIKNQRNAQALRKRAIKQSRTYKAGQSSRRLVAVFVIAAVLFMAVLARVTLLQTVQADGLQLAGKSQRTTEQVLKAHRGTIYDRDGADLALSVPARTIIANPKLVLDPVGTVRT